MKRRLNSKESGAPVDIINIDEDEDKEYWSQFAAVEEQSSKQDDVIFDGDPIDLVLDQLSIAPASSSLNRVVSPVAPTTSVLRKTRRGRLRLETRELYLHDEYPCGVQECSLCSESLSFSSEVPKIRDDEPIWILDTPVCMSQVDFLWDDPCINNGIVLQTSLDETQAVDRRAHKRLLRLLGYDQPQFRIGKRMSRRLVENQDELPPNRNFLLFPNENLAPCHVPYNPNEHMSIDTYRMRLIIKFATWYDMHRQHDRAAKVEGINSSMEDVDTCGGAPIMILTSDEKRKSALVAEGCTVPCYTLHEFLESVRSRFPNAGEKIQHIDEDMAKATTRLEELSDLELPSDLNVTTRDSMRTLQTGYSPHLSGTKLSEKIRKGEAYQGILRTSPSSWRKGTVIIKQTGAEDIEIKIAGRMNMNRAVTGDTVVVELLKPEVDKEALADAVEETTTVVTDDEPLVATTEQFGRIIGIAKRNWGTYCGSLRKDEIGEDCRFIPANPAIPEIMIKTRQAKQLAGQRLVVAIDKWDRNSILPRGHWIESLGPAGDPETEAKVILREHHVITREFSIAVLKCLPPASYKIPEDESRRRLDLRLRYCFCDRCRQRRNGDVRKTARPENEELLGTPCLYVKEPDWPQPLKGWHKEKKSEFKSIAEKRKEQPAFEEYQIDPTYTGTICCSIDPDTCVDIDDALSVKFLSNGNYEIGVHIADVTHYVQPETAIDKEAAERCTTVYLVNQRTDMLPKLLSADLCSLKSGEDRLTFSVFWEVTRDGEIKRTSFYRSIMHSVAALTYKQAQDMIDDTRNQSPVAIRLRILNNLAKTLKKKRKERGAVELSSTEVKFDFRPDDEKRATPTGVAAYVHYETHSLVEELMLLANMAVAKKIVQSFPDCAVLRRHPPPKAEGMAHLAQVLKARGLNFRYGTNAELAESLNKCKIKGDPLFNKMLRAITVQYMNQAVYFCTGDIQDDERRKHYALASDLYTHFTSPIRRYADILVHRLLAASLNLESLPLSASQPAAMIEQCDRMTQRHRNAQFCSRASAEYYAYQYFSKQGKTIINGIIKQVRKSGCFVVVPETGVNGQARVSSEEYDFDPDTETFRSKSKPDVSIALFDHVWVEVECHDEDYRFTVEYKIVGKLSPKEIKEVAGREVSSFSVGSGEVPANF